MSFWRIGKRDDAIDRPPPSVGADRRVYAIGDIHGRLDLLEQLLRLIAQDDRARGPMTPHLILLGDLIDRGPASRGIVERVMALTAGGARCVKGNHEELFLLAARGDERVIPTFRRAGGAQTLASYGLPATTSDAMDDASLAQWMLNHIPRDHVDFLEDLPDSVEMGDYLFVHAGIRPGVPIADQKSADMRWIRRDFLDHDGTHPRMIVHGHSISPDPDQRDNRVGIDTGAYYSGRLTAIGLQGTDRWFLRTGD
ncbi:metallophosphoesterase [Sphingobium sp.]|uniref:metallophosphoesterase n=1 Tax=Sphingobium sp. TaxID=1912891 RepID=UPI0026113D1B|nr:metallophosphoesterase [Sphingobium sp.]